MNLFEKCISLAMSIASRGFCNNKASVTEKQLRVLSCFGNDGIPPCPHLMKSANGSTHHCGACGCGDKPFTQLLINGEKYSKLDYPYLKCPLEMPGFSNYSPASPKEVAENSRKSQIEVFDILKLQSITVTNPTPTEYEYKLFQKLTEMSQSKDSK